MAICWLFGCIRDAQRLELKSEQNLGRSTQRAGFPLDVHVRSIGGLAIGLKHLGLDTPAGRDAQSVGCRPCPDGGGVDAVGCRLTGADRAAATTAARPRSSVCRDRPRRLRLRRGGGVEVPFAVPGFTIRREIWLGLVPA